MITSRRGFLRLLGGGTGAGIALRWPIVPPSRAAVFEPSSQDDGFTRLNRNENPFGPSPKVEEVIRSASSGANRYPLTQSRWLLEKIASMNHVSPEQVLLGCGSTEILRMAAFAFLGSGKQLIQASPTFEAIEHYARSAGSQVLSVRLTPGFAHDLDGMLAHASVSTTLVYICNPNNPTASLTPRKDIEDFIHNLPPSTFVIIDEAYHHYAGRSGSYASFLDRPLNDERVIVTRTFSKVYGLAGLRLGYAVASPKVISQMQKFATEANVNAIVTQAAAAALDDVDATEDFHSAQYKRPPGVLQSGDGTCGQTHRFTRELCNAEYVPSGRRGNRALPQEQYLDRASLPATRHIHPYFFGTPRGNARFLAGVGRLAVSETFHAALSRIVVCSTAIREKRSSHENG